MPVATPGTSTGARTVGVMASYYTNAPDGVPEATRAPDVNGVVLSQPGAARPVVLWVLRIVWVTLP